MKHEQIAPYAAVVIKLLQGVMYQDDTAWSLLITHQVAVRDYFGKIGVELYLDEGEGFAFLEQPDNPDETAKALPRLIRRNKLTYEVTLLCVLLRESLQQFEARGSASSRHVLSVEQMRDLMRPFYREQSNEAKVWSNFESSVGQLVKLGFLKQLSNKDLYEVRRILKVKISADILVDIKEKLLTQAEKQHG